MSKSLEAIVNTFFDCISQCNYDRAKDYMEKQRSALSSNVWPKSMTDILCDFALAEKNYSDTNFEPAKNLMLERKEDENYLDFVFKTLFQDLEKLQIDVEDNYVSKLITSLIHFISVRIRLLEFYDKLYENGSSNSYINFGEQLKIIENIQNEFCDPSPVDGVVNILHYELDCMIHLFKCHVHLENWQYLESLLSMKRGSDAIDLWETCHQNKESRIFGSLFKNNVTIPALVLWFKKFNVFTISKFTLYFHQMLLEEPLFDEDVKNEPSNNYSHFFTKMKMLQKKSEGQSVMLVFDATELENFRGPGYWSPLRSVEESCIKYHIMLSYPEVQVELNNLEKLILENNKQEDSLNKISLINIENVAYLLMRVDLKVTLVMLYDCQSKVEEKEKINLLEFATQLRCHKLFASVNRQKESH